MGNSEEPKLVEVEKKTIPNSIQEIPPVRAVFTMLNVKYKVIASDRIKGIFTAKRIK